MMSGGALSSCSETWDKLKIAVADSKRLGTTSARVEARDVTF